MKKEKYIDNDSYLHKKTEEDKEKHYIVFHGNNLNPLPNDIFLLYKEIVLDDAKHKQLDDGRSYELNGMGWYSCDFDDENHGYSICDYCYYDMQDDFLLPYNTSVYISLYHDFQIDKDLFYISIDGTNLSSWYMFYVDKKLENIYNRYKKIREDETRKYNQKYKQNQYSMFENNIHARNALLCETCYYGEQCDRMFCMLPVKTITVPKEEQFKINLHILEACNYRCRHCFAHFDSAKILPVNYWKHIVDNCSNAFFVKEFNIAGGEPLMYKDLMELVKYIHSVKAKCSIITNGLLMTDEWIKENAKYFQTIGFSIDSFNEETMMKAGRADCKGNMLTLDRFKHMCSLIKLVSPECKIKVNTVVTSLNKEENIGSIIKEEQLPINRWKVLKMDVFKNENFDNSDIEVSSDEYNMFVRKNIQCFGISTDKENENSNIYTVGGLQIVTEKDVNASYIMIDANGYLVDDSKNDSYVPVINCATEDFLDGLKKLPFNKELYFSRY